MNETLHDKAIINLKSAQCLYALKEADEGFVNMVGYHLQQAVELELKHILEINEVAYPHTSDISQLVWELQKSNTVDFLGARKDVLARIAMFAGTFTEWEAKTRYIKNFQLGIWQLDMGLRLVEEFVAYEQKTDLFK